MANNPKTQYFPDLKHALRVAVMRAELDTKLALRQRIAADMEQAIAAKEDRLRRLWTAPPRAPDEPTAAVR